MDKNTTYELAKLAFTKKEIFDFFLGNPPYNYKPKFSPAPGNTDLSELIPNGIFPYLEDNQKKENIDYLNTTLIKLSSFQEGMYSVACFMLFYNSYISRFKVLQEVDIEAIRVSLKSNIKEHKLELLKSKSILGHSSYLGLYGVLKTLSKNTVELGGISFFPEENDQDEGIKM